MKRLALTAAVLVLLGVAVPATASALTRKQANAIAVRVLHAKAGKKNVILFGLPKPLKAGTAVLPADPPKGKPGRKARGRLKRLRHAAWLYWLDQVPYALFSHRSQYLLVDNATGRVIKRAHIGWYPTVNARRPAFVTPNGYKAKRYRVFVRFASKRKVASQENVFWNLLSWPTARIPAGAFDGECVLIVADYSDPWFQNNAFGVKEWAQSMHIPWFFATGNGAQKAFPTSEKKPPDDAGVRDAATQLIVKEKCKDIFLYLSGHGQDKEDGEPRVATHIELVEKEDTWEKEVTAGITAGGLHEMISEHPGVNFKVKIDSCFSGRFLDDLAPADKTGTHVSSLSNLLIVEVSSPDDEPSMAAVPELDGDDNPKFLTQFTNQNLTGLTKFFDSQTEIDNAVANGGSLMARALDKGFDLGASVNHAIDEDGLPIEPEKFTNFGPPKPDLKFIDAVFYPDPKFTTVYTAYTSQARPLTGTGLTFIWTVVMQADFPCMAGFKPNSPNPNQASWYHADVSEGGPCNHFGTNHPGTVFLVVSNSDWVCTAQYQGTAGGTGPPATCKRK